jgi:hypothetical protein
MNGWEREKDHVVTTLSPQEAAVIRGLVGQIKDMLAARADESPRDELAELTGIRTGPSSPPGDQVLARLLPDFFRDDEVAQSGAEDPVDASAAMRSLHEPELVAGKTSVADLVLETCPRRGGKVRLSPEQADGWLSALNDVRLALGTALDVREDMPDEQPEDELQREHFSVYQWLTVVQDTLLAAVAP